MINVDDVTKGNIKEHTSGKTNSLFNLINQQPDIAKIYLYDKDC